MTDSLGWTLYRDLAQDKVDRLDLRPMPDRLLFLAGTAGTR